MSILNDTLIQADVTLEHTALDVNAVLVGQRQREIIEDHVRKMLDSFQSLAGKLQLQPILVTQDLVLIDGGHRLEAAKRAGWETISAYIVHGIEDDDRALLEAVANVTRQELNPVQLAETWRTILEPRYRKAGKLRQEKGLANLRRGEESPGSTKVVEPGSEIPDEPVSLPVLAKQETGLSLDSLNKVSDVQRIADSETASEELRAAAEKGLRKIRETGKIEPVWNSLIKMQERAKNRNTDPAELRATELEASVEALMTQMTLFADRLAREDETVLFVEAGRASSVNRDNLAAAKFAAARMLVALVGVEAAAKGVTPGQEYGATLDYIDEKTVAKDWR